MSKKLQLCNVSNKASNSKQSKPFCSQDLFRHLLTKQANFFFLFSTPSQSYYLLNTKADSNTQLMFHCLN